MSGIESSIFGKMTSRGAGKRQIKPTAVLFETLADDPESEDDEDFNVQMDSDQNDSAASTSSQSDEEESSEDSAEDNEEIEEEVSNSVQDSVNDKIQICSVCLEINQEFNNEDFMTCDRCGVVVHESCYGGIFADDSDDESSGKCSTTSWFCEPCVYNVQEQPYCEFCPSRIGAFKRSDVGGRWVHLICALYTSGISFSAIEALSGVCWQEVGNSIFGKRSCSACKDKVHSRVGVATACESGLCKDYLHVTCAQKLGLLVDETDKNCSLQDASMMRYFFCRKHCNIDNAKKIQKRYQTFEKYEMKRITMNKRRWKKLSQIEENRRSRMYDKLENLFVGMKGVTINIPTDKIEKSKRARYLNTSFEFLDKFEDKANFSGTSNEDFYAPFYEFTPNGTTYLSIGFSNEFSRYTNIRDTVLIPEEEKKLELIRSSIKSMKERLHDKNIHKKIAENDALIEERLKLISAFCNSLVKLCDKNDTNVTSVVAKLDENFSKEVRNTKSQQNGRSSKNSTKSPCDDKVVKICDECSKDTDNHLMTQCDECHNFYHIGCLNPPLSRLPKRSAKIGWICHNCNESDEDEEAESPAEIVRTARIRRVPKRHLH